MTVALLQSWLTPAPPLTPSHPSYAEFHDDPSSVELPDYLVHLLDTSYCPRQCLLVALIYVERILARPRCLLTGNNVHRLFAVSLMLASKFLEDQTLGMRDWSRVTLLSEAKLRKAEREFLHLLQWQVYCDEADYARMMSLGADALRLGQ